ncbi:MAG: SDR family oxidoreductase [Phycisphaerales bacterium]
MGNDKAKVAIITGAGSGVGEQIAIELNSKGYRCVLVGRTSEKLEAVGASLVGEQGQDWITIAGDVGIDADRERIIAESMSAFKQVDALVNNAGLAVFAKMADMTSDQLHAMFAVNVVGPVDLARRVVGHMSERGSGAIVSISSMAQIDPFDGLGVYGCTKGGVGVLAKAVANEYGDSGVSGYSICPGAIETQMLRSFVSEEVYPSDATLTPAEVASVVVQCVTGDTDLENGSVFEMPSH